MNLIDTFLAYVEPLKGSKRYFKWAILTVAAAMLERRVWLDRGRMSPTFPNLYTLLVGTASTGKSFAAEQAVNLLQNLLYPIGSLPIKVGPTKITQAALYQELQFAKRQLKLPNQPPVEQCPLFIYASELAINMVDFGGGTLTNELIDFYDSKGHNVKVEKRIVTGNQLTTLPNPSLTILGCTTQSFLEKAAEENLITSGLASRILFVCETQRIYKQHNHIELDLPLHKQLQNQLSKLATLSGPMRFDDEANDYYIQLSEQADEQGFNAVGEFMPNYYGRKAAHLSKIAMILAVLNNHRDITKSDVVQANSWLTDIEPNMIRSLGLRSIEKDPAAINKILSLIPYAPQSISEPQLFAKMQENGGFMPHNGGYAAAIKSLLTSRWVIKDDRNGIISYSRVYS